MWQFEDHNTYYICFNDISIHVEILPSRPLMRTNSSWRELFLSPWLYSSRWFSIPIATSRACLLQGHQCKFYCFLRISCCAGPVDTTLCCNLLICLSIQTLSVPHSTVINGSYNSIEKRIWKCLFPIDYVPPCHSSVCCRCWVEYRLQWVA